MAQFKQWFYQDFTEKIEIHHCESVMFTGDDKGAVIGVHLFDDGAAYSAGGTVTGAVKRSDGGLVGLTGTLSGNAASVVIPAEALAVPGPIGVRVILTQGGSVTTVLKAVYSVDDNTGAAVDPGTIIPNVNDLITVINTAVASIPSDYTALLHTLAPDFSASTAYVARDYVWYNGALYRFTANHAAGSWTGTDATAAVIADDLANLSSAFIGQNTMNKKAFDKTNVLNYSTIIPGCRLKTADGLIASTTNYSISDYIPVFYGMTITINYNINSSAFGSVFYDIDKNVLSTVQGTASKMIMTVPEGAFFFRSTIPNDTIVSGSETAAIILTTDWYDAIDALEIAVSPSENFTYVGSVGTGTDSITNDLDECYSVGIYSMKAATAPTNIPADFSGGGTLIVLPGYGKRGNTGPVLNQPQKVQVIIEPDTGRMWCRYASPTNEWRDWHRIGQPTIAEKTKWLAVGDSITFGIYSYIGSNGLTGEAQTQSCWVRLLAEAMGYDLTIMASRGMGYTSSVTGSDPDNPSGSRINLDTLLTRIEALTDDFNLVTLAFGINDYATSSATLATITTGLNDAIERLATKFKNARLVVITPLNSCRAGDASTNYAYNSPASSSGSQKTLKQVADKIKEQCEGYGVECVYATNGFLLNNYNITTLLPDNTHPSLTGHKLIAKNMAHYLLN